MISILSPVDRRKGGGGQISGIWPSETFLSRAYLHNFARYCLETSWVDIYDNEEKCRGHIS